MNKLFSLSVKWGKLVLWQRWNQLVCVPKSQQDVFNAQFVYSLQHTHPDYSSSSSLIPFEKDTHV